MGSGNQNIESQKKKMCASLVLNYLLSSTFISSLLLVEVPLAKGALATDPAMAVFEADSRSHSPPTMAAALPLWLPDGAADDALQKEIS